MLPGALDPDPGSPPAAPRVRTADGNVLAVDEVVCCAGRWTPELAAMAGATGTVSLVPWDTPGSTAPALVVRIGPVTQAAPVRLPLWKRRTASARNPASLAGAIGRALAQNSDERVRMRAAGRDLARPVRPQPRHPAFLHRFRPLGLPRRGRSAA